MSDLINANIAINIGVKKDKSDDLTSIEESIKGIAAALEKLKGVEPKIKLGITAAEIKNAQLLADALERISAARAGGTAGVTGPASGLGAGTAGGISGSSIGSFSGATRLTPDKIRAEAAEIRKAMNELDAATSKREARVVIGSRVEADAPEGAASLGVSTRRYEDSKGIEHTTEKIKSDEFEINGVLEKRVTLQKTVVDGYVTEVNAVKKVVDMNQEVNRKIARRSIQDDLKKQDINKNIEDSQKRIARWTKKDGFKEDPTKTVQSEKWINGEKVVYSVREFRKELKNGYDSIIRINEATNTTKSRWKENVDLARQERDAKRQTAKAQERITQQARRYATLGEFSQESETKGFKRGAVKKTTDRGTGATSETVQYWKARHEGIGRYTIALREYNTATGKMIERNLRGAESARFLGDSLFRAGEKVLQWTIATTVLFQAIRVIRELAKEVIELEANTIFLARVADKLTSSYGIATNSFEIKRQIAERLTSQIIELTQAIGGNASEMQHAAATFLRAGQSEVEVMQSVEASLLAARIAEMEVAEAATFLVSAQLQFNLAASESITILDSLNTLSNNYKVTTQDLFASISRAGSVYAAHNGKLEELAGLTAVLSEVTSRSGTQLGNALKTIQSRLDRVEVKKNLFKRLQISSADMEGKARSLGDMLLELKIRMEDLSETEQNEVTIQAAGVRQRAIMVSAINEADQALLAYHKTLMESGSASEEFHEQSGTIANALERIKGTFSAIAKSSSGSLGGTIRAIVNLIDGILRLINKFDGLAIKMVGYATLFLALRFATMKLVAGFKVLGFTFIGLKTSFRVASIQSQRLALRISALGSTSAVAGVAIKGLGAAFMAFLTPMNMAALGLGLAIFAFSELTASTASAEQATESYLESIDKQVSAEKNRREAIISSVNSIIRLSAEIHRYNLLQEASNEPGKYSEQIKSLQEYADAIAKSTGLPQVQLAGEGGKLDRKALDEFYASGLAKEQESLRRQEEDLKAKEETIQRSLDKAKRAKKSEVPFKVDAVDPKGTFLREKTTITGIEEYNEYARKAREKALELRREADKIRRSMGFFEAFGSKGDAIIDLETRASFLEGLDRKYEDEIAALNKVKELEDKIAAIERERAELKTRIVSKDDEIRIAELANITRVETEKLGEQLKKLREIAGAEELTGLSLPFEETAETLKEMRNGLLTAKAAIEEWIEKHRGINADTLKPYLDRLKEVNKELERIPENQREINKQRQSFALSQLDMRDKLIESIATTEAGTSADQNILSGVFGVAAIEDHMARIKARIVDARNELSNMMRASEILSPTNREAFLNQEGDKLSRKVYIQKQFVHLRDLELDRVMSIQKAEAQIASERKKSADEAMRALGMLSSQEKLRVLAQAQYFRKNPNRVISPEEAFMAPAAGVKTTRQFFNSKLGSFDPNGSIFEKLMSQAGLGETREIINSQDRLAESIDAAATVFDRANEALIAAIGFDAEARIIGGESAIADAPRRRTIGYQNDPTDPRYTININRGAIDFSGFASEFNKLVGPLIKEAVNAGIRDIRATTLPSVDGLKTQ